MSYNPDAYEKPVSGIPSTDLSTAVNNTIIGTRYLSTWGDDPAWAAVMLSTIGSSNVVAANNSGMFTRIVPRYNLTVSALLWVAAVTGNNYDVGILDAGGTRLWSLGSTAVPAGGTVVTETPSGVTLTGGSTYFIGWSSDSTTPGIRGLGFSNQGELSKLVDGSPAVYSVASVFPIPPSVTLGSTAPNRLPFFALRGT